jgi:hypothetical protein
MSFMSPKGYLCFIAGLGLLVCLSCSFFPPSTPDFSEIVSDFQGRSIPVNEIRQNGSSFVARLDYDQGGELTEDRIHEDLGTIFRILAEKFPGSSEIRIEIHVGGELVFPLEASTPALLSTSGPIAGEALANDKTDSSVQPTSPSSKPGPLTVARTSRGWVGRVGQVRWLAWVAAGAVLYLVAGTAVLICMVVLRSQIAKEKTTAVGTSFVPSLEVVSPEGERQTFRISSPKTKLGRDPTNTLVIDDSEVSRYHAEIVASEEGYLLRDLGSVNSTYVNGKNVSERLLHLGDKIEMGSTRILVGK